MHAEADLPSASFPDPADPDFDPVAYQIIRSKARQLVAVCAVPASERDDLEQELALKLVRSRTAFDPQRGAWHAFVKTVVERHAVTLQEHQRAAKRDPGRRSLLRGTAADLGDDDLHRRQRRVVRTDEELADLRHDVGHVLAGAPAHLRDLAARLMHDPLAQVARDLKVDRTTLYALVRQLRRRFEGLVMDDPRPLRHAPVRRKRSPPIPTGRAPIR